MIAQELEVSLHMAFVEARQQRCATPTPPWEFNAINFARLILRISSCDEEWEARICRV